MGFMDPSDGAIWTQVYHTPCVSNRLVITVNLNNILKIPCTEKEISVELNLHKYSMDDFVDPGFGVIWTHVDMGVILYSIGPV